MAVVGTAVIDVIANTAKFEAGMNRAANRASLFQRSVGGMASMVTTLAATGLAAATQRAVGLADAIGDNARLARLSTTAYQEMSYALGQLDVSQEAADAGLQRLSKTLGDARRGGKEAKETFKELGLDANQFQSGEQALDAVLQKLREVEDQDVRSSIASQLFGKAAGPQLAQALDGTSDALAKLRRQAHEVGAVMSEETIAKAGEAQRNFESLATVLKTQVSTALVELAPVLTWFGERLADSARGWGLIGKEISGAWREIKIARLEEELQDLATGGAKDATEKLSTLASIMRYITGPVPRGSLSLPGIDDASLRRMEQIRAEIDALRNPPAVSPEKDPASGGGGLAEVSDAVKRHAEALAALRAEILLTGDAEGEAAQKRALATELYVKGDITFVQYMAHLEEANQLLDENAQGIDAVTAAYEEQGVMLLRLQGFQAGMMSGLGDYLDFADDRFGQGFDLMSTTLDSAEERLAEFFRTGKMGWAEFADAIILELSRIAAKQFLVGLIGQSIGFMVGSSNLNGGNLGGPDGFGGPMASGGPVSANKSYLVGEEGPELFMSGRSGSIVPNDALGGRTEVNVYNQVSGAEATTERSRGSGGEEVISVFVRAVARDIQDGGPVAGAISGVFGPRRQGRGN